MAGWLIALAGAAAYALLLLLALGLCRAAALADQLDRPEPAELDDPDREG